MIGQFMAAAVAIVGRIRKKKKPGKSRQFSRAGVFAAPWALAESAGAIANVQASEFAHYLPKDNSDLQGQKKKGGGRPGKKSSSRPLLKNSQRGSMVFDPLTGRSTAAGKEAAKDDRHAKFESLPEERREAIVSAAL
ncbi:hypothetical protein NE553_13300, partial [Eggerthella lenta]|nr:hypothetical protein [Eggerthella lenta]